MFIPRGIHDLRVLSLFAEIASNTLVGFCSGIRFIVANFMIAVALSYIHQDNCKETSC